MKKLNRDFKLVMLLTILSFLLFNSCKDELPSALDTSSKFTKLEAIRLVNVGAAGDIVLEGTIDHDKKQISFPRIDPETNFENLKFEIQGSEGVQLEKESYSVLFQEGESERSIVLKVVNNPRSTEYFATFRLLVPVYGADFSKPTIYDYSANPLGNPVHNAFTGQLTRGAGFDGEHVLVVSRASSSVANPHLLKVEDLKNNQINRIVLNVGSVVTGGTILAHSGAQINGHTYVSSLSGATASPLKIYHWADPNELPQVVWNQTFTGYPGAGARHGDNASYNIDDNGNGYIHFISQQGPIFRLKVSGFTTVSEPTVLTVPTVYNQWSSMLRVGTSDNYLLTGNLDPISIASSGGAISYTMARTAIPIQGVDARVVEFNGERYMIMVTVPRSGTDVATLYVYNITRGLSLVEALTNFAQTDRAPLYQYTISSATNSAPASQTGYKVIKDSEGNDHTLQLFAATTDAGFAIIEFPVKTLTD